MDDGTEAKHPEAERLNHTPEHDLQEEQPKGEQSSPPLDSSSGDSDATSEGGNDGELEIQYFGELDQKRKQDKKKGPTKTQKERWKSKKGLQLPKICKPAQQ